MELEKLKVVRCLLSPHELGLLGFEAGSYYLAEEFETLSTVFLPRLDYLDRIDPTALREAGTIRRVHYRAYFHATAKTGKDYI